MIQLIVDYSEEIGFWYFVVREDDQTVCFRPGFRTQEQAREIGDQWIRDKLGGVKADSTTELPPQPDREP